MVRSVLSPVALPLLHPLTLHQFGHQPFPLQPRLQKIQTSRVDDALLSKRQGRTVRRLRNANDVDERGDQCLKEWNC